MCSVVFGQQVAPLPWFVTCSKATKAIAKTFQLQPNQTAAAAAAGDCLIGSRAAAAAAAAAAVAAAARLLVTCHTK